MQISVTLEEKDGWLFVKDVDTADVEPTKHIRYWPIGLRFADFARARFNSTEEARTYLGCTLYETYAPGMYRDEKYGWQYRLVDGGQTRAEHFEKEAIPAPVQRGRKLEIRWLNGCWQKNTATRGWVRA